MAKERRSTARHIEPAPAAVPRPTNVLSAPEPAVKKRSTPTAHTDGGQLLDLLARARARISPAVRREVYEAACGVALLVLLDAVDALPNRGTPGEAASHLLARSPAVRLAVLLERVAAPEAHAVVAALHRAGFIAGDAAQLTHARIDLRSGPEPVGR